MLAVLKHSAFIVFLTIAGNALVHSNQFTEVARHLKEEINKMESKMESGFEGELGELEARMEGKQGELEAHLESHFQSLHKAMGAKT